MRTRSPHLVTVAHTRLFSGAERVLARYVEAARERGWTVTGCAPPGPLTELLRSERIATVALPELKPGLGPRLPALVGLAGAELRASRLIRSAAAGADVVLVNGLMALPATTLARLAAPVCWLVHDVVTRRDLRAVTTMSARSIDAAIAPSAVAAQLPRRLGIRTEVVVNGTPLPPLEPTERSSMGSVVGLSGAITPWKGQDVLLEAVAQLPDVTVELMGTAFPGDQSFADALRRRATASDLRGRVRFLGQVDDPIAAMRRWTVAVSASVEPEAGSLALLEALSLGLPVVASDHGCAAEYVGTAGELVPPGDPTELAAAIHRLVENRDRARCLGAEARQRVETNFTLAHAQQRFVGVINERADQP